MTVDKELLFKPRLPKADVTLDLEGIGEETFRVRALSRAEALEVQKADGVAAVEQRMLAFGLLVPRFTEGQIREWQEAAPAGELDPLTERIAELSGMDKGAAKGAYVEFDQDPDAEFRVLPRGEAGDDRGPAGG